MDWRLTTFSTNCCGFRTSIVAAEGSPELSSWTSWRHLWRVKNVLSDALWRAIFSSRRTLHIKPRGGAFRNHFREQIKKTWSKNELQLRSHTTRTPCHNFSSKSGINAGHENLTVEWETSNMQGIGNSLHISKMIIKHISNDSIFTF